VCTRVQRVVEEHMLRYCSTSDPSEFRSQLQSATFQHMFAKFKAPLRRLFRRYCSTEGARGARRHASSLKIMLSQDWLRLGKDFGLIDARLSHRDMTSIFCNVQHEGDLANTTDMEVRVLTWSQDWHACVHMMCGFTVRCCLPDDLLRVS